MKQGIGMTKLLTLSAGLFLLAGCATPALWTDVRRIPAEDPHLALALATDATDVLVSYDEAPPKLEKKCPRSSYWLFAFANTPSRSQKHLPNFESATLTGSLAPIPVIDVGASNDTSASNSEQPPRGETGTTPSPNFDLPTHGYYAVTTPGTNSFHLFQQGRDLGEFALPYYAPAPLPTGAKIALTPLAVAFDLALIAVAVFGAFAGGYYGW
jgi:hypothetical protein